VHLNGLEFQDVDGSFPLISLGLIWGEVQDRSGYHLYCLPIYALDISLHRIVQCGSFENNEQKDCPNQNSSLTLNISKQVECKAASLNVEFRDAPNISKCSVKAS